MDSRNCYISQSNVINVKRLLQQFNQTIALSPTLFHDKNVLEKAKFWGNIFERTHLYLGLCGHNSTHRISEERRNISNHWSFPDKEGEKISMEIFHSFSTIFP